MDAGHPLCWLENKPKCICPKDTKDNTDTKATMATKATMPGRTPGGAQGSKNNEYRVYVLIGC